MDKEAVVLMVKEEIRRYINKEADEAYLKILSEEEEDKDDKDGKVDPSDDDPEKDDD